MTKREFKYHRLQKRIKHPTGMPYIVDFDNSIIEPSWDSFEQVKARERFEELFFENVLMFGRSGVQI